MSFSSGVKDELARVIPEARHCRIAEIAAMISLNGRIVPGEDGKQVLSVTTEHAGTARNYFTLIKKTYKIGTDIAIQKNTRLNRTHSYTVSVRREQDIENILEGTKLNGTEGSALFSEREPRDCQELLQTGFYPRGISVGRIRFGSGEVLSSGNRMPESEKGGTASGNHQVFRTGRKDCGEKENADRLH